MATCNTCFGTGQINGHGYENCSGCGGSGQAGGGICPYCGGSGTSSIPNKEPCYTCHGTGIVDDPPPSYAPSKKSVSSNKTTKTSSTKGSAKAKNKASLDQSIATISVILALIVGYLIFENDSDIGAAAGVSIVTFFVAMITLYIAYYVLRAAFEVIKVVLTIAIFATILLFIGNMMEIELATNITTEVLKFAEKTWLR